MSKTLKWIYKLGVLHERRRIKLLIAQYRGDGPREYYYENDKKGFGHAMDVWNAVGNTLNKLTEPPQTMTEYNPTPAPIDFDNLWKDD